MLEQTHLFAAMDHAHRNGRLSSMLRIEALLERLQAGARADQTGPRAASPRNPGQARPVPAGLQITRSRPSYRAISSIGTPLGRERSPEGERARSRA